MVRANKNKEAAVGSQNRTVSPNEAKSALTHCIKLQRPIMMWGAPGIGKSDIVKQIADAEGREVIDIRLPLWEPTDIKGIPYYNATENNMVWASPAELPTDPKSNAIVFLDELNSAAPAVQAAAYQLILNRRVGQYTYCQKVFQLWRRVTGIQTRASLTGCRHHWPTDSYTSN
jgi:MoxR-like ATPase